jgi:UPF0716 protein FxsA
MILFPLLLAVPAAEIFLFVKIGGMIGAWPTIGLILATAAIGGTILRIQGTRTLERARRQLANHQVPVAEIAQGAFLVLAAILLLIPGFITDFLGTLLLLPPLRHLILAAFLRQLKTKSSWHAAADQNTGRQGGPVIDGEYSEINDDDEDLPPPGGNWGKSS